MTKLALFVLFAGVFAAYSASQVRIQTDSLWSIPTAASLLHEGNANLDEFRPTLTTYTDHGTCEVAGHTYYEYPLGAVLGALPFLAATEGALSLTRSQLPHWGQRGADLEQWLTTFRGTGSVDLGFYNRTEQLIASFYVCAAVVVLFLALRRQVSDGAALASVLLFAFGTTAYSTASRVLWQHAPSLLAVACIVLLLARPAQTVRTALLTGLVVACAYVCRPTNALSVLVVTAFFALRWTRLLPAFFAGASVVALPFCAYNLATYGALLSPYYAKGLDPGGARFFQALAANLISPSRGLLIYSPFLFLSGVGVYQRLRRGELQAYDRAFLAILVLHWLAISAFPVWWAGHSVGPRFFTDVLPYCVYFLASPLQSLLEAPRQHRALTAAVLLTAGFSVAFHWRASTSFAVHAWNSTPTNVDERPERAWDWKDPQFLRAIPGRRG
ncbi:hypothetical protein DRW03_19350 [Corallococcus sp. H22C18031201]|uniref:hypothetical protein n=1 Tax=Citreicoccus inhibens TaxID=2849499 RepID=UPI000E771777|nr:hypothetical protein [Citreicoccus inhibens]MBU8896940.1 hypothetical protein [Citreicoccus inhibens]RJS20832.1 hypothetical protein DRW03_19350 [Corallococcus sp. H22C18031201]